tara:strand:+ start:192 stop:476 length:285 start_codon:yes stop_codon:yes gene_type:complete
LLNEPYPIALTPIKLSRAKRISFSFATFNLLCWWVVKSDTWWGRAAAEVAYIAAVTWDEQPYQVAVVEYGVTEIIVPGGRLIILWLAFVDFPIN